MNSKLIRIVGLNIGIIFLLLATTAVVGSTLGSLYCCPSVDPIVDGDIGAVEWKYGTPRTEKLYNIVAEADYLNVEIQSVYGNDLILYFGITYLDAAINPEDYFFIVFKTVEGDPLVEPPYGALGSFGAIHDVKMIWQHNNVPADAFTNGTSFVIVYDTDVVGGTNNVQAKCKNNGTHTTIEMSTPFNSGDTAGKDFNIGVGTTISILLWFHDEDKHIDFTQILEATNDYQWLDLYIGCKPAPIPIAFVLLGLMTTASVSMIIKRRRK
ncbi:MAG: hypothetical protein ACTSP7_08150 [Candidatus Heimdallarchaeota archaeon]